jgi:putative RecB family exonuclease
MVAMDKFVRLFSCTPSRLTTWLDCPRRYRMTYVDRPRPKPGPPWAHNSLGASVHSALAGWWRLPRERRTVDAVGVLLEGSWSADGFKDSDQADRWRSRATSMVASYVSTLDPDREPVGVERTLGARTGRLALSGRVDRLDDRAGLGSRAAPDGDGSELVVVDYKTGRRPPTADDVRGSLALALYAIAAAATLRRPCRRVELNHLPTGVVEAFDHTDASLGRHLRRAEQIADDATAAGAATQATASDPAVAIDPTADPFPPRPGAQCGWCDLRAHCPEGMAAGPARLPWAALGELEVGPAAAASA